MNDKTSSFDQFCLFACMAALVATLAFRFGGEIGKATLRHRCLFGLLIAGATAGVTSLAERQILKILDRWHFDRVLFKTGPDSIRLGKSIAGKTVFIPNSARRMHTQVIGTTNAGKTESVILPWAVDDIARGRGLILIDGKSDRSLLDKLYAYTVKYKRSKDFRLLSLVNIDASSTFNPLTGGSPDEVAERIFAGFTFEDEYYRNVQFEVLKNVLLLLNASGVTPTFSSLTQIISEPARLTELAENVDDPVLQSWVSRFAALSRDEREKRTSGLLNQLGHFTTGETSCLFNTEHPNIRLDQVMREGLIVYCQVPVLKTPTLGKALGKLVLQSLQSAIADRHLEPEREFPFFAVYLDDFTEYLTPGFVSLLNKSRSANVGITFAHQAHGDLAALGDDVRNSILTNSNLKVFMRTNEPETAEYFSRSLGTRGGVKLTERQRKSLVGSEKTGDSSSREVEEFLYHPNLFKRSLGTGEAVIVVPFQRGSAATQLKFEMLPDLLAVELPFVLKVGRGKPAKSNPSAESKIAEAIFRAAGGAA